MTVYVSATGEPGRFHLWADTPDEAMAAGAVPCDKYAAPEAAARYLGNRQALQSIAEWRLTDRSSSA